MEIKACKQDVIIIKFPTCNNYSLNCFVYLVLDLGLSLTPALSIQSALRCERHTSLVEGQFDMDFEKQKKEILSPKAAYLFS